MLSVLYGILIPLKMGNTPMTISRGLQSRARSRHGGRVGSSFGVGWLPPPQSPSPYLPGGDAALGIRRNCSLRSSPFSSSPSGLSCSACSLEPTCKQNSMFPPLPGPEGEGPETWAALLRLNQYEHSDLTTFSLQKQQFQCDQFRSL